MRTLAMLGVGEKLLPLLHVQRNYQWFNGDGQLLIEHDFAERGASGWAEWYRMYQPELEDALNETCRAMPGVEVRFDAGVQALSQDAECVIATVTDGTQLTARWVIGCDGANGNRTCAPCWRRASNWADRRRAADRGVGGHARRVHDRPGTGTG